MTTQVHTIYGPPGTGKTQRLLTLVQDETTNNTSGQHVGYFAFTKAASREAKARTHLTQAPYFRTLHSLCFEMLGMNRKRVLGSRAQYQFLESYGIPLNMTGENTVGTARTLMYHYDQSRIRGLSIDDYFNRTNPRDIESCEVAVFARIYNKFKLQLGLVDFTDLLLNYVKDAKRYSTPDLDVIFVDEAQDLSRLQWQVLDKVLHFGRVKRAYIAGDDDQAIYAWAGADADSFTSLPGTSELLQQSHRVPKAMHAVANRIIRQVKLRKQKLWLPVDKEGAVKIVSSIEDIDFSKGEWLVLARENKTLWSAHLHLEREGILYRNDTTPVLPLGTLEAIEAWKRIQQGHPIRGDRRQVQLLQTRKMQKDLVSAPTMPDWPTAFDRLTEANVTYLRVAIRKGEDTAYPRVRLSSIHASKGAQCDNVVVYERLGYGSAIHEMYTDVSDTLHRLFYVAVTRAVKNLYIVDAHGEQFHYPIV